MDGLFSLRKPEPIPESGNPTVDDARARALDGAKTVGTRGRKRRGAPENTGDAGGGSTTPALDAEVARQLEQCYRPEPWGALLAAPGEAMCAITGKEYWSVKDQEKEMLGETAATAARFLITQHPRTLAIIMLSSAVMSVYLPRLTKHAIDNRKAPKSAPTEQKS